MSDPAIALANQLKNIEARTGRNLAQLRAMIEASGLAKHGEQRSWLMAELGLGHGDANTVVTLARQLAAAPVDDPLDAIYSGAKAGLRPLHEAVMARMHALGPFEIAPKKTYLSLRRKKQFAMLGPATKDQLELGLNAKALPPHPRLKALPPGGMCPYSVRLAAPAEIDATLDGWLRAAYAAAG
jgi:Domain of unknown function (DUF5655)/Domain of unknown function (DUF4287)